MKLRKIFGVILIIVGIIGLVLPFVPGTIIILSGIALINPVFYKKIIKNLKSYIHKKGGTKD